MQDYYITGTTGQSTVSTFSIVPASRKVGFTTIHISFSDHHLQSTAMAHSLSFLLTIAVMMLVVSSVSQAIPFRASQFERNFNGNFMAPPVRFSSPSKVKLPRDETSRVVDPIDDFDTRLVHINPDTSIFRCQERDVNGDLIFNLACIIALRGWIFNIVRTKWSENNSYKYINILRQFD